MGDYRQLQHTLDKVIDRIGLQKTNFLLESFINNVPTLITSQKKVLSQYVTDIAIKVFDLREADFLINQTRAYRDARFCCFRLLEKYTDNTFRKTAEFFNNTERMVSYGHKVTKERLEFPKFHPEFVANYKIIESKLIELLARMN